jgi:hypothetical protein
MGEIKEPKTVEVTYLEANEFDIKSDNSVQVRNLQNQINEAESLLVKLRDQMACASSRSNLS